MPSTPADRFAQIKRTKDQVNKDYYDAMAATTTPAQAQAVDQNYYMAELAFVTALKQGLEKNNSTVESAFSSLKNANDELKAAKLKAEGIASFLKKMTAAAKLALKLASIAAL